jgi:hypothetical protein
MRTSTAKTTAFVASSLLCLVALSAACGGDKTEPAAAPPAAPIAPVAEPVQQPAPQAAASDVPADLPKGLLIAYAQFVVEDGKVQPKPGPARLEILTRKGGQWNTEVLEDPESNVFHKAMVYGPESNPGILTMGGMAAAVKLWHRTPEGFKAQTLWTEDFGGKWNRMRDAEVADVYGDGKATIVVATHDQGIVATVSPDDKGGYKVNKLDKQAETFVHEIEIGDLNKDGVLEVYATLSDPNKLEGTQQRGVVVSYVPKLKQGRKVVADLGNRHAKEIYVGDVDGDGTDELYVAVEALTSGDQGNLKIVEGVEIRRYDADTAPDKGVVIAKLDDRFCRFLTVGDVDGDGKKEMVAAAFRSGLWLLKPGNTPKGPWSIESIDRESSGFEHTAVFADLDGDKKSELYVASDEQGELRRYVWVDGKPVRSLIHKREIADSMMTWNIMPTPVF